MGTIQGFLLAGATILLFGCAAPAELTVPDDQWTFEKRAITFEINAPADLNERSGRPHAISLSIFQLSDPNTFSGLSATREGATELMNKGKIDDTIVDFKRLTVQPSEKKAILISRAKDARHIGVISGYYRINPQQDVYLFPVPIEGSKRGLVEKLLATAGLISNEADALPTKMQIRVDLGRLGTKQAYATKIDSNNNGN